MQLPGQARSQVLGNEKKAATGAAREAAATRGSANRIQPQAGRRNARQRESQVASGDRGSAKKIKRYVCYLDNISRKTNGRMPPWR